MIRPKHAMLNAAGLQHDITQDLNHLNEAFRQFLDQAIVSVQHGHNSLPEVAGIEKHPYKGVLENVMADIYILGTFPPISYMVDIVRQQVQGFNGTSLLQPGVGNVTWPQIPFYHGNVAGLWNVLLTEEDRDQLQAVVGRQAKRAYLIDWLELNQIFYDDIVHYAQRRLHNGGYTPKDTDLYNIRPDFDLVAKIMTKKSLRILSFVNGSTFRQNGFALNNQNADPFTWFIHACRLSNIAVDMRCQGHFDWTPIGALNAAQRSCKIVFDLRFTPDTNCTIDGFEEPRELQVMTPYSPAAFLGVGGNPIYQALNAHLGDVGPQAVLRHIYDCLRDRNLDALTPFNQE